MRGELWWAYLGEVESGEIEGHEQEGHRPVLIISNDRFNRCRANMVTVVPLTEKYRGLPIHYEIEPPEGGLKRTSYAQCEQIRTISKERLDERIGLVSSLVLAEIEIRIKAHLDFS
jgi:mRNA interferase MazF